MLPENAPHRIPTAFRTAPTHAPQGLKARKEMRDFLEPDPGSRTTPRTYYEHFVRANLYDYLERPDDIRLAFNASVTAFQMRDIAYCFYEKNEPSKISRWPKPFDFQIYLVEREPLFQTIQSVATVFKHLHTYGQSYYQVGSPGALWALNAIGAEVELQSDWEDVALGDVVVRRLDGTIVSMTKALQAVVDSMWPAVLQADFSC
jgi:hypothetical protein